MAERISMNALAALALCTCSMALAAPPRDPRPDHELDVGAQKEQVCEPRTLVAIGRFLHVEHFRAHGAGAEPYDEDAVVEAAACKAQPGNPRLKIVAAAFRDGAEESKALVIALLDEPRGQVLASYRGHIDEDAAMKVEPGSLWIDTAAYDLQPGVRAFGLDVTSGYQANCGDGGLGATRALYVPDGTTIRPVLEGLTMSYWHFVQEGRSRCNSAAPEGTPTITEISTVSIGVAATTSHGFHDLWLGARVTRDDGQADARRPARLKLTYDGSRYSSAGSFGAF